MNPPFSPVPDDLQVPLPKGQFQRFMIFFHVVLIAGLSLSLGATCWQAREDLGWQQAVLAALVVAQVALYLRSFAFLHRATLPSWWYPVYALLNLAIWAVQVRLSPFFHWVGIAFLAQTLAALPPRRSLPIAALYLVVLVDTFWGWRTIAGWSPGHIALSAASVVCWLGVGLFIHRLAATSEERAQLIAQLRATQKELELARQRDAEVAILRERERLARELHDSLGHSLVTLTVQLEAIQRLYAIDPPRASALVDELKSLTRSSMEDLRRSLANLRAPGLGERKLSDALKTLANELGSRAKLGIDLRLPPEADQLQPAVAEALWRVAQEALTNVEKHALARTAVVALELEPQLARMRVTDDGAGLPPDAEHRPGHFGLRGLRERVEGLGGTLMLSGASNQGTVVEARLPIC